MNKKRRKRLRIWGKIFFVLYIVFIIYFLLFSEWYGRSLDGAQGYRYNLVLFQEIKRFWIYREQLGMYAVFTNLIGNVLIFVPLGFFMPMASRHRSFIAACVSSFLLSLGVETFQLITKVGSFDVDDILLNTIGGALGFIMFVTGAALRRRHVKRSNKRRR